MRPNCRLSAASYRELRHVSRARWGVLLAARQRLDERFWRIPIRSQSQMGVRRSARRVLSDRTHLQGLSLDVEHHELANAEGQFAHSLCLFLGCLDVEVLACGPVPKPQQLSPHLARQFAVVVVPLASAAHQQLEE
jgi:hypothetical protein